MKKRNFLLPLFTLSLAVAFFTGCNNDGHNKDKYDIYSNASRYSAGNGTIESVSSIDVEWVSGKVNLEYSDENVFTFKEETDYDLESNESVKMRWYLDGGTLKIKFAKSGAKIIENLQKTLTLTVPNGAALQELDIETVSANINCNLNARKADFETVSGKINFTDAVVTGTLKFGTVSGEVNYSAKTFPALLDAETVSGNLRFGFPEDASFSVKFESLSGNMNTDRAFNGTQNGKYFIVNGGLTKIDAETVSGNLTIEKTIV